MLMKPPVFRQCQRIPGPQLADAVIQKAPPGHCPLPDQVQILRAEQHALKNAAEFAAVFQLHTVGTQHPPGAPVQLRFQQESPFPRKHTSFQKGMVYAELDQFLIIPCPMADARKIRHRFQQIGLSLGVVAIDYIDIGIKSGVQMDVIAEEVQT